MKSEITDNNEENLEIEQMCIWDALCDLAPLVKSKKRKSIHGGVLLLVKLQAKENISRRENCKIQIALNWWYYHIRYLRKKD